MHQGERSVAAHTAGLKKELGLGNLVLTQILFVMGLSWVGAAAKLGLKRTTLIAKMKRLGISRPTRQPNMAGAADMDSSEQKLAQADPVPIM